MVTWDLASEHRRRENLSGSVFFPGELGSMGHRIFWFLHLAQAGGGGPVHQAESALAGGRWAGRGSFASHPHIVSGF